MQETPLCGEFEGIELGEPLKEGLLLVHVLDKFIQVLPLHNLDYVLHCLFGGFTPL
jgi:hypothetical protein